MTDNIFPAKVVSYMEHRYDPDGYDQVVINKGSNDGIKIGQRFIVYSVGKELFDPDTNESLGNLEIVKGTGTATHVQEKMTTITTDMYKKIPRKITSTTTLANALLGITPNKSKEYVEEFNETKIPFKDVKKGDFVRPIS